MVLSVVKGRGGGQEDLRCLETTVTQGGVKGGGRPGGPQMPGDMSYTDAVKGRREARRTSDVWRQQLLRMG